ncbi:hypothetical protein ACHQM5_001721 [Ranunculus cassubicifolius]
MLVFYSYGRHYNCVLFSVQVSNEINNADKQGSREFGVKNFGGKSHSIPSFNILGFKNLCSSLKATRNVLGSLGWDVLVPRDAVGMEMMLELLYRLRVLVVALSHHQL